MSPHRRQSNQMPEWLWFFLALPLGLFVMLLIKRRQVAALAHRLAARRRPRYSEPDSIPIEEYLPHVEVQLEGEALFDAEDVALSRAQIIDEPSSPPQPVDQEPEETQSAPPAQQAAEQAPTGAPDDLKVIEGIGPAIAGLLEGQGIRTFRQLAETPLERLDQILSEAKLRRLADPQTWSEQAALAAAGRWDELAALQRTLSAGRRKQE